MDPITIASTAFQLASLAQTIYNYIDSVNNAEKWLKPIGEHVKITSGVLENVATILANDEIRKSCTAALLQTTEAALDGCRGAFEDLDALIRTFFKPDKSGRVVLTKFAKLTLTFRQSEIGVLQAHLDRFKSSLDLVLGVLNLAITTKSNKDHDEIQKIKIEVQKLMRAEQEAKDNEERIAKKLTSHPHNDIPKELSRGLEQQNVTGQADGGLPQPSAQVTSPGIALFATQHQRLFPSSTPSTSGSQSAHLKKSQVDASPLLSFTAKQHVTALDGGPTHVPATLSTNSPIIAPPIRPPPIPLDQTILYHHLNKCAEAATKLASTIEQVTTQWQYARQYQRNSIAPAFEVTKHALENLSAYEHHLVCDAKGLHREQNLRVSGQPLQGPVLSKVPSPKVASPNFTPRWPSWSRRKAQSSREGVAQLSEAKVKPPGRPTWIEFGADDDFGHFGAYASPTESSNEGSTYTMLRPGLYQRTEEPKPQVHHSSEARPMPSSSYSASSQSSTLIKASDLHSREPTSSRYYGGFAPPRQAANPSSYDLPPPPGRNVALPALVPRSAGLHELESISTRSGARSGVTNLVEPKQPRRSASSLSNDSEDADSGPSAVQAPRPPLDFQTLRPPCVGPERVVSVYPDVIQDNYQRSRIPYPPSPRRYGQASYGGDDTGSLSDNMEEEPSYGLGAQRSPLVDGDGEDRTRSNRDDQKASYLQARAERLQRTRLEQNTKKTDETEEIQDTDLRNALSRPLGKESGSNNKAQESGPYSAFHCMGEDLRRRGAVDARTNTMDSQSLFVANPDLSDDEEFTMLPQAQNSNNDSANSSPPNVQPRSPSLPDVPAAESSTAYAPPLINITFGTARAQKPPVPPDRGRYRPTAIHGYAYPGPIVAQSQSERAMLNFDDYLRDDNDEESNSDEEYDVERPSILVRTPAMISTSVNDEIERAIDGPDVSDVDELLKQWIGIEA